MLKSYHKPNCIEAGVDEVGRGSFAGPVVTAAVILPSDFTSDLINDSKKLSDKQRRIAAEIIYKHALAYSIQAGSAKLIDETNINKATFITMHKCLAELTLKPEHILVDGNVFEAYENIPHTCIEKGDGLYLSIAAASIIAKVKRDDYMKKLHEIHPFYGWNTNAGYHSKIHVQGLKEHGATRYHRTQYIKNFI